MQRSHIVAVAAASVLVLMASACGGEPPTEAAPTETSPTEATPPKVITEKDFDRNNFDQSTSIDNEWFPITPGTQFVYEGHANVGKQRLERSVVFTVTDLTKVIDGVRTVVMYDVDYNAGQVVEAELAFFAQDDDGNVWLVGEYPEEYEEGEFQGAPDTWLSGLAGATAGVLMRAEPAVGTSGYFQGLAPAIDFRDRAKVYQTGQTTCVPLDCYENVLVIDEWNPDERGAHQLKFHATGLGVVRVGFKGAKEKEQETLVLVDLVQLSPEALAEVRAEALKLEERAYMVSKDLYGHTPPAEGL